MKSNRKRVLFTALTLVLISFPQTPISAITNAKSSSTKLSTAKQSENGSAKKKETNSPSEENLIPSAEQDKLAQLAQIFIERPDDNTYNALWENFVAFTEQQVARGKDPSRLFRSWKVLSQAGLKVIDPIGSNGAMHIYTFNRPTQNTNSLVPQTKHALIQWNEQIAVAPVIKYSESTKNKKARTRKIKTSVAMKIQSVNVPSYVDVKEANLLPHIAPEKVAEKSLEKTRTKSRKGSALVKHFRAKENTNPNHFLAILGTDLQSGHTWLLGLKQSSVGWINYPDLLQDIPTFLLQTSSAKIKFSGDSLIITMNGPGGYELVMPFVDDHFAFSTKEAQDSANAVAHQFLLALQYKRLDLAKVWLSDPKLASIPVYLGLFNRLSDSPPLRLINMPPPLCGGSRFRLLTSAKDDLILDVARIKNQWLIKALFIAPGSPSAAIKASSTQAN